jgi:hypothetical protein
MATIDECGRGIMNRHTEIVRAGAVSIETYVDGDGPAVVVIPSYGRNGSEDFEPSHPLTCGATNAAAATCHPSNTAATGERVTIPPSR